MTFRRITELASPWKFISSCMKETHSWDFSTINLSWSSRDTMAIAWNKCAASWQNQQNGIHPVWSVFAVRMKKAWVLSYPFCEQWGLWSDWADAQADMSLRWAHGHLVGFVMRRLKYANEPSLVSRLLGSFKCACTTFQEGNLRSGSLSEASSSLIYCVCEQRRLYLRWPPIW